MAGRAGEPREMAVELAVALPGSSARSRAARTAAASRIRALSRHSSYSLAARESATTPLPVPKRRKPRSRSATTVRIATFKRARPSGPGPADRAGVDAARRHLGRRDDLHRALLRRPRDRGAREERREERGQRCLAARRDARGHLQQRRIALDVEERGGLDAAELGDAPEVVAQHVDDHQVLGALLLRAAERRGQRVVLLRGRAARRRPLHRPRAKQAGFALEEQLRRGRDDREAAEVHVRRVARPLGGEEPREERAPAPPRAAPRAEGEVDLVGVPRGDPLVEPRQPRRVRRRVERRPPRHVGRRSGGRPRPRRLVRRVEDAQPDERRSLGIGGKRREPERRGRLVGDEARHEAAVRERRIRFPEHREHGARVARLERRERGREREEALALLHDGAGGFGEGRSGHGGF